MISVVKIQLLLLLTTSIVVVSADSAPYQRTFCS